MSFDNNLLKINKKAIKILKKTPNTLLEFLTTNSKTGDSNGSSPGEFLHAGADPKLDVSQKATVTNGVLENSLNNLDSKLYSKQQITARFDHTGQTKQNTFLANQKSIANVLNKYVFNKFFICCKESRIESPTSFYGCFYIGPFDDSLSQTLAHNIRRTLLSQLSGFAITAVEIDGVLHKFSNLPGIKENVLDILCNVQNLVLKEKFLL